MKPKTKIARPAPDLPAVAAEIAAVLKKRGVSGVLLLAAPPAGYCNFFFDPKIISGSGTSEPDYAIHDFLRGAILVAGLHRLCVGATEDLDLLLRAVFPRSKL